MSTDLERRPERALATPASNPFDGFYQLDTYAVGGVDHAPPRVDAIATISAGYRGEPRGDKPGLPQRSTNGRIYLHDDAGRAPGLKAALEETDYRRLTVTFPVDDPRAFIQQRFVQYNTGALVAYGDELAITMIETTRRHGQGDREVVDARHVTHVAGSNDYEAAKSRCKTHVSIYFSLARWEGSRAVMAWPDGMGFYRLRTVSRHSLRNIVSQLRFLSGLTGGKLAGIPFDLSISNREVAGPDGAKRTVPVWSLVHRPPEGITLDAKTFRQIALAAREEAGQLQLQPPGQESMEMLALDAPPIDADDVSAQQLAQLQAGGLCDRDYWTARWHAIASDTRFDSKEARGEFIARHTGGKATGLAAFLSRATEDDAEDLVAALQEALAPRPTETATPGTPPGRSGSGIGFGPGGPITEQDEPEMTRLFGTAAQPAEPEVLDAEYVSEFEPDPGYDVPDEETAKPAPPEDPMRAAADGAVLALRDLLAENPRSGERTPATPAQVKAVGQVLERTLGLGGMDIRAFLVSAFDRPTVPDLTTAEADALLKWATQPGVRERAAALVALFGGRQSLL